MATLPTIAFVTTTASVAGASSAAASSRRVSFMTRASKSTSSSKPASEEKGLLDFILGSLTKQDQFYETDPILNKTDEVEKKGTTTRGTQGTTTRGTRGTLAVTPPPAPKKTNGGFFGGLFPNK